MSSGTPPPSRAFDGLIGEAWSGTVPNGSHINVILGERGTPTGAALASQLGHTTPGHAPFLACLGGSNAIRPATIVRNKTPLVGEHLERMTWGAAQLGIAQGIAGAVANEVLPADRARDLIVLVSVWVDPRAFDETALREANRAATYDAVLDAIRGGDPANVAELLALSGTATNDFYRGG